MNLESTNLGNWTANEVVSNTEQISNYTESTFVHLSGDCNVGTLSLSGNLNAGDNLVSGKNSCAFGDSLSTNTDYCFAAGYDNVAGMSCFVIDPNLDFENNIITIEGTQEQLGSQLYETVGFTYSFHKNFTGDVRLDYGKVLSVLSYNKISVDMMPPEFGPTTTMRDLWFNDKPHLGTKRYGYATCATGYSTKALGICSHSEGYNTLAAGKYAHAEGQSTIAGYSSHSEGRECSAIGLNCHAEGFGSLANNLNEGSTAHAEGYMTSAFGRNAHVEGRYSTAIGDNSHAGGCYAKAVHDRSYVWSGIDDQMQNLSSNGEGTYNIYAKDGLNSVYVNGTSLNSSIKFNNEYLQNQIDSMDSVLNMIFDGNILQYADGHREYIPNADIESNIYGSTTKPDADATLKEVKKLGSKIDTLAPYAFYNKTELKSINCDNITSIQENRGAFANTAIEEISLPKITNIAGSTFMGCKNLKSINAPLVSTVNGTAFQKCYNLTSINLDQTLFHPINSNGFLTKRDNNFAVAACPGILSGDIEDTEVNGLSAYALYLCDKIEKLSLPNCSTIYTQSFAYCSKMTDVELPNVENIDGVSCFNNCKALSCIDFSNRDITVHANIPTLNNANAFTVLTTDYKIVVPDEMKDAWKSASNWNIIADHIFGKSEI